MEAQAIAAELPDRPEAASTPHLPRAATVSEARALRVRPAHLPPVPQERARAVPEDSQAPVPEALAPEVSVGPVPEASAARVRPECVPH